MTYFGHQFKVDEEKRPVLPQHEWLLFPRNVYIALLLRDNDTLSVYGTIDVQADDEPSKLTYKVRHALCWNPLLTAICRNDILTIRQTVAIAISFEQRELMKAVERRLSIGDDFQIDPTTPFSTGFAALYFERDMAHHLHLPWLLVIDRLYANDTEGFDQALLTALQKHRYYYEFIQDDFGNQHAKDEGWISLALAAACVLARQQGLTRSIESDYLIEWLIEGDFEGLPIDRYSAPR